MKLRSLFFWLFCLYSTHLFAQTDLRVIQIYPTDDLAQWIKHNQHLTRVVEDDCQLVQDIRARAEVMELPTYQFLWGDMLAWGVCVDKDPTLGMRYIEASARQGFPSGLEQLGRYYVKGIIFQQDIERGYHLLRKAAQLDVLKAQVQLVELILEGYGHPQDYESAYRWLHFSEVEDKALHAKIKKLLAQLATMMPESVLQQAKTRPYKQRGLYW